MNIKKRLEREANSTHQQILEDGDKSFLTSLQERISKPKRNSLVRRWKVWLTGAACTISAAIIVVCVVLFTPNNQRVIYYEENFQTSKSDVATLNADLKEFQLDLGDDFTFASLKRTIDGLSGDLLFYEGTLQKADNSIQTNLTIVCNRNFKYDGFPEKPLEQITLPNYSVSYYIEPSIKALFQNQIVEASAKIEGQYETIYLMNYYEIALDENGSFLDFIQDLIQVKE